MASALEIGDYIALFEHYVLFGIPLLTRNLVVSEWQEA